MIGTSLRSCGSMKHWNGVLAISNTNLAQIVSGIGQKRSYAKKGDTKELDKIVACSKEISQTAGKKVEAWPKSDPPPPCWRYECPQDPQPPNYDPYRIKVPDVVVPPLPPSNAKWMGAMLAADRQGSDQGQGYGYQQQQYDEHGQPIPAEEEKDEGLIGILKSFFGRGKKNKSNDQMLGGQDLQWNLEVPSEDGRELFRNPEIRLGNSHLGPIQDLFHNSPIVHPDYWKDKPEKRLPSVVADVLPRLGYHGKTKFKYAFHEPWKPIDRLSLLAQAEKEECGQADEAAAVDSVDKQMT